MFLLLRIGEDLKREARIAEFQRKRREEKTKKKRVLLEKKMAYHLRKLQEHSYQSVAFESPVKSLDKLLSEKLQIKNEEECAVGPSCPSSVLSGNDVRKTSFSSLTLEYDLMQKNRGSLQKDSDCSEMHLDNSLSGKCETGPEYTSSSSGNAINLNPRENSECKNSGCENSGCENSGNIGNCSTCASRECCEAANSTTTSKFSVSSSGVNLSSQPPGDGPLPSSVVSQQSSEIANDITHRKRASYQEQEVLENNMALTLQENDYQQKENHEDLYTPLSESQETVNQGDSENSPSRQLSLLNKLLTTKTSLSSVTSEHDYDTIQRRSRGSLQKDLDAIDEKDVYRKPSKECEVGDSTVSSSCQPSFLNETVHTKTSISSVTPEPNYNQVRGKNRGSYQNYTGSIDRNNLNRNQSEEYALDEESKDTVSFCSLDHSSSQGGTINNSNPVYCASGKCSVQNTSNYDGKDFDCELSKSSRYENSNMCNFCDCTTTECCDEARSTNTSKFPFSFSGTDPSSQPSHKGSCFIESLLSSVVSPQSLDEIGCLRYYQERALLQNNLNKEIKNKLEKILTWVVAKVNCVLYSTVTEYNKRTKDKVYAISEESRQSLCNSSSCRIPNGEIRNIFGSLPSSSTRNVFFTDENIKSTSSPSDLYTVVRGKPQQFQKPLSTSLTKSTPISLENDIYKGRKGMTPQYHKRLHTEVMSGFPKRKFNSDKYPFNQTYSKQKSAIKDARPKKWILDNIDSDCKQDHPKSGIFKKLFAQQSITEAHDNDSLMLLQVAKKVVKDIFMRVRDLDHSVSILKKAPIEMSEKLFCSHFKRTDYLKTFHKNSQKEVESVAKEIVETVFENFLKCLESSIATATDQEEPLPRRKEWDSARGMNRVFKSERNKCAQSELPVYDPTLPLASIDKIAKETVENVLIMLESFVAFQFKHDFNCKFSEIVKFPVENISSTQQMPLSPQGTTEIEMPGAGKRMPSGLEPYPSTSDLSRVSSWITKESIHDAVFKIQRLHSELSMYASIVVYDVLEIIQQNLEREINQSETNVTNEIIRTILDRCSQQVDEFTSELKFGNLQIEESRRVFASNKGPGHGTAWSEKMKIPARKLKEICLSKDLPSFNIPGMVFYSEEESEIEEGILSNFLPTVLQFSEQNTRTKSEGTQKSPYYTAASRLRSSRTSKEIKTKEKAFASKRPLPPIGRPLSRKPCSAQDTKPSPKGEVTWRPVCEEHGELMTSEPSCRANDLSLKTLMEDLVNIFVSTILNSVCSTGPKHRRLAERDASKIADPLKQTIEKIMPQYEMDVVGITDEEQYSSEEYEETVNQVVHSAYSNVLQESGSQQDICDDVTSPRKVFPKRVPSMILSEISTCNLNCTINEDEPTESPSATNLHRFVDRALSQVSSIIPKHETEDSPALKTNEQTKEMPPEVKDLPIEIAPCIKNRPIQIDPEIVAEHLAVISIKTEPLETPNAVGSRKAKLSQTVLRKVTESKESFMDAGIGYEQRKKSHRRSSVTTLGRLDVRPRELVCRNSFRNLKKPDIGAVELLKDVQNKNEFLVRLVTFDTEHKEDDDHELQQERETNMCVIKVESSLFSEIDPLSASGEDTNASSSLEEVELTQFTVPKAAPDLSSTTDLPSAQKKNSYILSGNTGETSPGRERQNRGICDSSPQPKDIEVTSHTLESAVPCGDLGYKDSPFQEDTEVCSQVAELTLQKNLQLLGVNPRCSHGPLEKDMGYNISKACYLRLQLDNPRILSNSA
ncbi:fibrous sheath-interacting protein 2-like [Alligator sinensis]|uniref:Fibrous sheath-interacting protein 2-like n=1 Tax=Alligator sinensis TaxID=38654 RepID=A0A3Q0GWT5_ALLSI|nr:fibrous sheath-interacting protein 2-like [Alligator sinensis]